MNEENKPTTAAPLHGIVMTREQFEWTAKVVWATLEPWLKLHFGEKCPDYEFGCECCQRWKLAEELLAYDRIGTPADLQQEIATLEECLQWRKELLASMTADSSS